LFKKDHQNNVKNVVLFGDELRRGGEGGGLQIKHGNYFSEF